MSVTEKISICVLAKHNKNVIFLKPGYLSSKFQGQYLAILENVQKAYKTKLLRLKEVS